MSFDFSTLITDRTQGDVSNRRKKGFYNASDLNRVGACIRYLHAQLLEYGYPVPPLTSKTEWTARDAPTRGQMDAYLQDIAAMRAVLHMPEYAPATPTTGRNLNYARANDIETILLAAEETAVRVSASFLEADAVTMWAGSPVHLPSYPSYLGRTWKELDAIDSNWRGWEVADWYLLLYGNLKDPGRKWKDLDAMNTTWRNWQAANWHDLLYGDLKAEGAVT